jgi:SAM-dependent methyltransferase
LSAKEAPLSRMRTVVLVAGDLRATRDAAKGSGADPCHFHEYAAMVEKLEVSDVTSRHVDTRPVWSAFWSSVRPEEADVWYHLDQRKFRYLLRFLPAQGKTLEVGCGSARVSRFLSKAGFDATALDYEKGALECASREFEASGLRSALILGDGDHLPFRSGSFDVVLSTGLLEHFEDPSSMVREMVRVLRPGGVFYSDILPKKFSLLRSLDFLRRNRPELFERPFTRHEIVELLAGAELSDITVFAAGVFPPRLPLVEHWRWTRRLQNGVAAVSSRFGPYLDSTRVADLLGVYYFACGRKPRLPLGQAAEARRGVAPLKRDPSRARAKPS